MVPQHKYTNISMNSATASLALVPMKLPFLPEKSEKLQKQRKIPVFVMNTGQTVEKP